MALIRASSHNAFFFAVLVLVCHSGLVLYFVLTGCSCAANQTAVYMIQTSH